MKFVMHRDRVVATRHGHVIEFKKGVPTHVPPIAYDDVRQAGGEPEEPLPEEQKASNPEPADPVERKTKLTDAIRKIVERNDREDFTASGAPHGKAIKELAGFSVDAKERDQLWMDFQQSGGES